MRQLLIFLFLFVSSLCLQHPQETYDESEVRRSGKSPWPRRLLGNRDKRVPDVLEPLGYYIRIQPYFPADDVPIPDGKTNMTFDGLVTFVFRVKNDTKSFTMHSAGLSISKVLFMSDDGDVIEEITPSFNVTLDHIILTPSNPPLQGTTYMLQFTYTGIIHYYTDGGLFYTSYVDVQGKTHWMIATHLESRLARTVFPCLDEPAFKSYFHLTLIYPGTMVALSNAFERDGVPLSSQPGWKVVQFPPTLKMSTYLVAFAIGPYVAKTGFTDDGTLVRVFGWTGQEEYLEFAVNTSVKCMQEMARFTNFKYPMYKSDQLGLPEFLAGAMENYGLIIYKYQFIAFNPKVHSTYVKQGAAKIMCHELSHQWFGNTVTAMWWDDLFLQEGFASFFQIFIQEFALPEQQFFLNSKFLIETYQQALDTDGDIDGPSHPVYYYDGPAFDDVTYLKGASLLRMIRHVLGFDVFQEALQNYIANNKFSNANHEMLFAEFTKAAQKHNMKDWCGRPFDASRFLDPWFLQQSFPLLTVTNNQNVGAAIIEQQPYNDIEKLPNSSYGYAWPVPMFSKNYENSTYNGTALFEWLVPPYEQCEGTGKVQNEAVHWYMENAGTRTFTRILYDDIGYARLISKLKANRDTDFSIDDKIGILGDQIAFLNAKQSADQPYSYKNVLELLTILLPNFPHFGTFELSQPVFDALELMFVDHPDRDLFKRFMQKLLEENYNTLGWNVTGDWDTDVARYLLLPYAVRFDVADSVEQATVLFQQFMANCNNSEVGVSDCEKWIHPDVHRAVYCGGIRSSSDDATVFDELLKLYDEEFRNDGYFYQEYYAMLEGMACTTQQDSFNKLIKTSLQAQRLPQNDYKLAPLPSNLLILNPLSSTWMAEYLLANKAEVLSSENFEEYLSAMSSVWYSPRRLKQLSSILAELDAVMTEDQRNAAQAIYNTTEAQVTFGMNILPDIVRFLYDNVVIGPFEMENWNNQIETSIRPLAYDLTIQPYFPGSAEYEWYKNLTFDALVDMNLVATSASNEIQIHSHRMIIDLEDIQLTDAQGNHIAIEGFSKDYDNAVLTLHLGENYLEVGANYSLTIAYKGFIFGDPSKGVYTNTNYFEFNDRKAFIFATYFESGPSARSLVPCIDEPSYKARWRVTMSHPSDLIPLGNMPDQGTIYGSKGWARTVFMETPPMSSYLLSVAAGHFAALETVSETGSLVRLWTWTGMERYAESSLKAMTGAVDFMASYFNYSLPLPKLDAIALPQYTSLRGAEENWGLIQFYYSRSLADPLYATAASFADLTSVSAHETIHQWFGNLITMNFWPRIFLNEGFANHWETNGVEKAFPEQHKYNRFERFRKASVGFTADSSLTTTKPVIPDSPSYFTNIPYYKGASLLTMLKEAIGEKTVQKGLQAYIKEHAFSNADDQMLWSAITQAAHEDGVKDWNNELINVSNLMDPWMYQATYPILRVTTSGDTVTYSQEPFIADTDKLENSSYGYLWPIPVVSMSPAKTEFHYFIGENGTDSYWRREKGEWWHIENPTAAGFFRVWYDDESWKPIKSEMLSHISTFDEITRAKFVSDAVALQTRGLPWARVLDISVLLYYNDDYAPFYALKGTLDKFLSVFAGWDIYSKIIKYVQRVFYGPYIRNGWSHNGEWTHDLMSSMVTEYSCRGENEDCLNKSSSYFKEFIVQCSHSKSGTGACNEIPPDLRRTQYCYGLRQNVENYEVVMELYGLAVQNSLYFDRDADNLLNAFACVQDETLINRLIAGTINGEYPSKSLSYIALYDDTKLFLWNYFTSHTHDVIYGVPNFSDYITAATSRWNSDDEIQTLNDFLTSDTAADLSNDDKNAIKKAVVTVQSNIDWINTNEADIYVWLNRNVNWLYS